MRGFLIALTALLSAGPSALNALAQCEPRWVAADLPPGTDQTVRFAIVWDQDGPGPSPPMFVIGGDFTTIDASNTPGIAVRDFKDGRWAPLGPGLIGSVRALIEFPDDGRAAGSSSLIAAGLFSTSNGQPLSNVARWNGMNWNPVGTGLNGVVHALAVLPDGSLIAGGDFTAAGATQTLGIARWDGAAWSALGAGFNGPVHALCVLKNGQLVAAGQFDSSGGKPTGNIATWNGSSWTPLAGAGANGPILALAETPDGRLVAGGGFTSIDGVAAEYLASLHESEWSPLGGGLNGPVRVLLLDGPDSLVVGGSFTLVDGVALGGIARLESGEWSSINRGVNGTVLALAGSSASRLIIGGDFTRSFDGLLPLNHLVEWSGVALVPAGRAIRSAFTFFPEEDGSVIIGGAFDSAGGVQTGPVARWDDSGWSPIGGESPLLVSGGVHAIDRLPNGDLVIGGNFIRASPEPLSRIARWDGTQWHSIGAGASDDVYALLALPDGSLIAGGTFLEMDGLPVSRVARWTGTAWEAMGSGLSTWPDSTSLNAVRVLTRLPTGDIIAGGSMREGDQGQSIGVSRWTGTAWQRLGRTSGVSGSVRELLVLPNGDLLAGGSFLNADQTFVRRLARWDGQRWTMFGGGANARVDSLALMPNGDVIASGSFTEIGGVAVNRIARWNGVTWLPLGSGLPPSPTSTVERVGVSRRGDVVVCGTFTTIGGIAASGVAIWTSRPDCPADHDCNGTVDLLDLMQFTASWSSALGGPVGLANPLDLDVNRRIDLLDLLTFLQDWSATVGRSCP